MPNIKINGQTLDVPAGITVIEAFKLLKEPIAHYCWHPGLSIAGVCRLCMIEIEGNPRLQIACNTVVQEGMVINNNSEKVKSTVKWGLDFHLINHPLDCPICDQAGECELQNQYMEFGTYDSEMAEKKVKKRKVVDLGERVVLDSERCILCSRCVRFTKEVTQTNELGIFNRGDHSEIGTFEDKPLNNKYSVNTVDICPVGALTSKDFRFKQRVWYLKDKPSVCTGCSTGCNVDVYYNEEGVFRIKPRHNPEINGYWMCDEGRDIYKHFNKKERLVRGRLKSNNAWVSMYPLEVAKKAKEKLSTYKGEEIAFLLTAQYTNEELESVVEFAKNKLHTNHIFVWKSAHQNPESFDGLLIRGDKNPNSKGLENILTKHNIQAGNWESLSSQISKFKAIVVVGPEQMSVYQDLSEKVSILKNIETLIWCSANDNIDFEKFSNGSYIIPQKVSIEKSGHFTNYKGIQQKIETVTTLLENSLNMLETIQIFSGLEIDEKIRPHQDTDLMKLNQFTMERGNL